MSKKRKLGDLSVEEFWMNSETDDVSSEASFSQETPRKVKKIKKTAKHHKTNGKTTAAPKPKKKKSSLQDLKEKDPEFYEFLLKEDKELLEDDDEDEESDDDIGDLDSDDDDSSDEGEEEEEKFQPPAKLEVASDDDEDDSDDGGDDSDEETSKSKKKLISAAMMKSWRQEAQDSPSVELLRQWVAALAAAAQHAGLTVESGTGEGHYRVETNGAFNAVMRLCLTDVVPLIERLLGLKSLGEQQQVFSKKNKKWKSVGGTVKNYCVLILQLSGEFSEASVVNAVLKHVHKLLVCYAAFPKLTKALVKNMVKVWSTGEETSRVFAFLVLNKLIRLQPDVHLDPTLKQMYMAYVKNCKFVSPTSLPLIGFMQRSLVEAFLVRESVAYQHAFVYIRQLAIHLRNAIVVKKKEQYQLVYNWQYVLSLGLWSQLLTTSHPSPTLQPLLYPLVQIITGVIRLLPIAQYYPLRFHCVRYLNMLSAAAFIPVLPFLLEVLEQTDFNKRQKGGGLKDINMTTILKFSKPQLQEKVFKEAVIGQLCELLFDYLNTQSHTVAFPELIVPLVIQLKDFTKKCKVATLCRQIKQVLDKAEETVKVVEARRRSATFNLADSRAVESWESRNKEQGTPLSKFYVTWRKNRDLQQQQEMVAKDTMKTAGESMVPEMNRAPKGPAKASDEDRAEFGQLFASDDEEEDDSFRFLPKAERPRKEPDQLDSDEDYSDFDSDDLEQLAKSASEDEGSDDADEDDEEEKDDRKSQKTNAPKGKKQKKQKQKKQAVQKPSPQKQKKQTPKKPPSNKKLHIENDRGDIVQDFTMSDSD